MVKDLLDHFNGIAKIDAQLEWRFEQVCVSIKSTDRTTKKRQGLLDQTFGFYAYLSYSTLDAHLATEIIVDADDFDVYSVHEPPISLCFHLREFNVCKPPSSVASG